VGGGTQNIANGYTATVPGGTGNRAAGLYSFAAGRRAKANHAGVFVLADATDADFTSTEANQFLIRASGGVGLGTNSPGSQLDVKGTLRLSGSTSGYVGLAPAATAGSTTYILPSFDGTNGQALTTNGAGVLSWSTSSGGSSGWNLTGNAGTIYGTHFLGTTDNKPLDFRVNNQPHGRLEPNGSVFLGYLAGSSNTGFPTNTGIGYYALKSNTDGSRNTANGFYALSSTTTGQYNTAIGSNALPSNTTGYYNTAIGGEALFANINGNNNTALGERAGLSAYGSGNVFLGFHAGYSESGSNKLYIANSEVNPPLIYGDFSTGSIGLGTIIPGAKLDIVGTVIMTGFKLPTNAGAGLVLKSDVDGNGTWGTASSGPPSGMAGGDLLGSSYPDPIVADNAITSAKIANGTITGDDIATGTLSLKNTHVAIANGDGTARELRLFEPGTPGTNYTSFAAQAQAVDINYTLPAVQGVNNTVLTNNGSGALSWALVQPIVSKDVTLTGDGNTTPLGVDLTHANNWSGVQTFSATPPLRPAQGNALINSMNFGTGYLNASRIGNGLTDAQVDDAITIDGGTIGATAPNTGAFTSLSAGGVATPLGIPFVIDLNGNITRVNNITAIFPSAQGANNTVLTNNGSGTLSWGNIPLTGTAGGDLIGSSYPNPTVAKINGATLGTTTATPGNMLVANAANAWTSVAMSGDASISNAGLLTVSRLQNRTLASTAPTTTGQAIIWNNTASQWEPGNVPLTGTAGLDLSGTYPSPTVARINGATLGITTATPGNMLVANAANAWTSVTMSGDASISNAGLLTVSNDAITSAKIADETITGADIATGTLSLKNTHVAIGNNDGTARELRFFEAGTPGTNYTSFKAQAQVADVNYTLPAADGTAGQVLSTNASGILKWTSDIPGNAATATLATTALYANTAGTSNYSITSGTSTFSYTSGTAESLTTVLGIGNGGTGSSTQNFVGLTGTQSIGGAKTFLEDLNISCSKSYEICGFNVLSTNGGIQNVFVGAKSGTSYTSGSGNTYVGGSTGYSTATGSSNTILGYQAGYNNSTGNGNVFLGNQAGYNETGSNQLYIANSSSNPPLIYGDFSSGKVGIGITGPTATLDIVGSTGYNQLRMRTSYTPTGSTDANGNIGDIAWDDNYVYVKTSTGWKRSALGSW
jgi:hypothetical protein